MSKTKRKFLTTVDMEKRIMPIIEDNVWRFCMYVAESLEDSLDVNTIGEVDKADRMWIVNTVINRWTEELIRTFEIE